MEDKTQLGSVESTVNDGIASITFSHPAHNSLPGRLLSELAQTIRRCGEAEEVKVILVRSGGDRTFCAGASFDELMAIKDFPAGKRFFMGFANVINAMRKCPKLIIGRVQGKAVGGGVGIAAATDYCLATRHAALKLSELAIGIGPFVVGPAVARKVGDSAMSQLAMNPTQWRPAEWAQQKGLYADLYDDSLSLDAAVSELADKLAGYHPAAMAELKTTFWAGTENWDQLLEKRAELSGRLVLSDFTSRAIEKFKQKA